MGKVSLEDLEVRKQELISLEKKLKNESNALDLEMENLTEIIEKSENGKDWKTLSSEVIEQNNGLRNRVWGLKIRKRDVENKIISVHGQIVYVKRLCSSKKSKEKDEEFDNKLSLVVPNQVLRRHFNVFAKYLLKLSDDNLEKSVLNRELLNALKIIKSIVGFLKRGFVLNLLFLYENFGKMLGFC